MGLRPKIAREVSRLVTSGGVQSVQRSLGETRRRLGGRPHEIDYFHDIRDPYSQLAVEALPGLASRRGVVVRPHLVPPPPDWAAPERAMLEAYGRRDATLLAARFGLSHADFDGPMADEIARRGEAHLADAIARGRFIEEAPGITAACWRGTLPEGGSDPAASLTEGAHLRESLGHYLGATFHYGGEWYWGIDRLHYLESRLETLGAPRSDGGPTVSFPRPTLSLPPACRGRLTGRKLELFFSFRSPYSYIVLPRVFALADHYGAELDLRFVLPMVTRGLPVPAAKRLYIVRDTAREARSEGMRFGPITDPLGEPVARGLAILHHAIGQDHARARAFALSFLQGVFADGIDAGSARGLSALAERAGISTQAVDQALADEDWRQQAEANRQEMIGEGLWGVPSLRFEGVSTWGQDRLWHIETALIAAAEGRAPGPR